MSKVERLQDDINMLNSFEIQVASCLYIRTKIVKDPKQTDTNTDVKNTRISLDIYIHEKKSPKHSKQYLFEESCYISSSTLIQILIYQKFGM